MDSQEPIRLREGERFTLIEQYVEENGVRELVSLTLAPRPMRWDDAQRVAAAAGIPAGDLAPYVAWPKYAEDD